MSNDSGSNPILNFFRWLLSLIFKPMPVVTTFTTPRKVMVIIYHPDAVDQIAEKNPGNPDYTWTDPDTLVQQYIESMKKVSNGALVYQTVEGERYEIKEYPKLELGHQYTDETWLAALPGPEYKNAYRLPDGNFEMADYQLILNDPRFNILQKVKDGIVDEVWIFNCQLFGFYESRMVGQGAFRCNSQAISASTRKFVIMGFNYFTPVKNMLHDYGHRVENILAVQFHSTDYLDQLYEYDKLPDNPPPPPLSPHTPKNDFEQYLMDKGTVHRIPGGPAYSQDEFTWLSGLKPEWWPPTIEPNMVKTGLI
jgi:hypothetical protein